MDYDLAVRVSLFVNIVQSISIVLLYFKVRGAINRWMKQ